MRREGDKLLNWLKKEETPGSSSENWRRELLNALRDEEEEHDMANNQKKRGRKDVKAPWSYQSFVEAEPRNFQRGKKRQGKGTDIYLLTPEEETEGVKEARKLTKDAPLGRSYVEMTPTFCEVMLGTHRTKKLGLLDSCAQLSLIGRDTIDELRKLEEVELHEKSLKIKGISASEAHHFCEISVVIRAGAKPMKMTAEFWVVESLNESFVLGMDCITKYGIDLHISKKIARMTHEGQQLDFPLYFGKEWKEELIRSEYNVRSKNTITIPPRMEGTVEVVITCQDRNLPAHDLFLEPVVMSNLELNTFATAGKGIISSKTSMVWFANMGDQPVTLNRGMKLGTVVHLQGNVSVMLTEARHETGDRLAKKQTETGGISADTSGIPAAYTARTLTEVDILGKNDARKISVAPDPKREAHPREGIGTTEAEVRMHNGAAQEEFSVTPELSDQAAPYEGANEGAAELPDPNDRPPPGIAPPTGFDGFDISIEHGSDGRPPENLLSTLQEFGEAFTDGTPGRVKDGTELALETTDEKLTPLPLRHQGPRKRGIIDETIDQLLEWGIIEKSESKVSYPVVIVGQNGKNRFCVDYRSLNQWTSPMFCWKSRGDSVGYAILFSFVFLSITNRIHALRLHCTDMSFLSMFYFFLVLLHAAMTDG